jgi:hypothetical protein
MRRRTAILFLFSLGALGGCSSAADPSLSSSSPKPGSLGNGDFYFKCDDSVSCAKYLNVSKTFPEQVAEGAVFHIGYARLGAGTPQLFDRNPPTGTGDTLDAVGSTYLSLGNEGFVGVKAGTGTIVVRTASGNVVDFTTLSITKPDEIVVYDAGYTGSATPTEPTFKLPTGTSAQYRTLARRAQSPLAGVFETEWVSDTPAVLMPVGRTGGVETLQAVSAGKANVTVSGAGLTRSIQIEVTP